MKVPAAVLLGAAAATVVSQACFGQLVRSDGPCVTVTAAATGNVIRIVAANRTGAPATVVLDLAVSKDAVSRNRRVKGIVPPHARRSLACVTNEGAGALDCRYTFRYALGKPSSKHDDRCLYRLPYDAGGRYAVGQSYGGAFSHTGAVRYAVDFAMPEGTPVCAAREGFVVMTESSRRKGGAERDFKNQANCVLIQHTDGTIAAYMHLKHNGVIVKTGDVVGRGEVIGYSGSTGWATGPHLHFSVHRLFGDDDLGDSIPVRFETGRGVVDRPAEGTFYEPLD